MNNVMYYSGVEIYIWWGEKYTVAFMAVRYRCKSCGYVLFEFSRAGQDYTGIPTPEDIVRLTGGICPRCKKLISVPSPAEIWNSISIRVASARIPVERRIPGGEVAEA